MTLSQVLEIAGKINACCLMPVVLMGYYNPILQYGLERFGRDAAAAGVDGLIIPDRPRKKLANCARRSPERPSILFSWSRRTAFLIASPPLPTPRLATCIASR